MLGGCCVRRVCALSLVKLWLRECFLLQSLRKLALIRAQTKEVICESLYKLARSGNPGSVKPGSRFNPEGLRLGQSCLGFTEDTTVGSLWTLCSGTWHLG